MTQKNVNIDPDPAAKPDMRRMKSEICNEHAGIDPGRQVGCGMWLVRGTGRVAARARASLAAGARPLRLLLRRAHGLPVRQRHGDLGRPDRRSVGRRHHPVRHVLRRRARRLRAALRLAPDAGARARHVVCQLQRPRQRAVVPCDRHRHGQRAARVPREPARSCRLRHGIVDSVRDRRHRLGEHALLAHRPHDGQRGCKSQQHPRGLDGGRRPRLPPRSALDHPPGVSLHQPRPRRPSVRLGARALRFAI